MVGRREDKRVVKAIPVRLSFTSANALLDSYTKDLSLGGLFVRTKTDVPVGTRFDLTIDLGGGSGLRAIGEVKWRRPDSATEPGGVGVRFVEMNPAHRKWLDAALKQYTARMGRAAASSSAAPAAAGDPASSQRPVASAALGPSPSARPADMLELDLDQAMDGTRSGHTPKSEIAAPGGIELSLESEHELRAPTSSLQLHGGGEEILNLGLGGPGLVLGIDLGTSNCAACAVIDGEPVMVNLSNASHQGLGDNRTLPSVVSFDDQGSVKVGHQALEGMEKNTHRTVFGAKRFIGRAYDSPAVQKMLTRFPYKIVPAPHGRVGVSINGRAVALTEVAAHLLKSIVQKANEELPQRVQRAIITVPAYYNDNQRAAVVQAGMLAGITVERIINEPTAAAIACGLTGEGSRNILVYDLGGGTFDVSVMRVEGSTLTVLATGGDTFLGGEDFDQAIVRYVIQEHRNKTGKGLSQNHKAIIGIKVAAEQAKKRLSLRETSMVTVRQALMADGSTERVEVELSREVLGQLVEPLIQRSLEISAMTLKAAALQTTELSEIILVGGQTRMPWVRKLVGQYFGRESRHDLNPDEVVAMGAGMLAHIANSGGGEFHDVLSMSISLGFGVEFRTIIPCNSPVPCAKSFRIQVPRDKMQSYAISVFQGDEPRPRENEHLGTLKVDSVAGGTEDPVALEISVSLSDDCLLHFTVTNLGTDECQTVVLLTRDIGMLGA